MSIVDDDADMTFTQLASRSGDLNTHQNPLLADSMTVSTTSSIAHPATVMVIPGQRRLGGGSTNANRKPRVPRGAKRQPVRHVASGHGSLTPGRATPPSALKRMYAVAASGAPSEDGGDSLADRSNHANDLDRDIASLSAASGTPSGRQESFTCHLPGSDLGTVEAELAEDQDGRRSAFSELSDRDGNSGFGGPDSQPPTPTHTRSLHSAASFAGSLGGSP